jgi:hypothetical protein
LSGSKDFTRQDDFFIDLLKRHGAGVGSFVVLSKGRRATLTNDNGVEISEFYRRTLS